MANATAVHGNSTAVALSGDRIMMTEDELDVFVNELLKVGDKNES